MWLRRTTVARGRMGLYSTYGSRGVTHNFPVSIFPAPLNYPHAQPPWSSLLSHKAILLFTIALAAPYGCPAPRPRWGAWAPWPPPLYPHTIMSAIQHIRSPVRFSYDIYPRCMLLIGQAGASPFSRTTARNFLYLVRRVPPYRVYRRQASCTA